MNKYDTLGLIWTITAFLGIIGLGLLYNDQDKVWTWQVITVLLFTVASFVLALHFTMHDFAKDQKKEKKNDE